MTMISIQLILRDQQCLGYKGTEHPELVKEFFRFVTTTESLQSILDNSNSTNLHVNNEDIVQGWIPAEEEFVESIGAENMIYPVLQNRYKLYKRFLDGLWSRYGSILPRPDRSSRCT